MIIVNWVSIVNMIYSWVDGEAFEARLTKSRLSVRSVFTSYGFAAWRESAPDEYYRSTLR